MNLRNQSRESSQKEVPMSNSVAIIFFILSVLIFPDLIITTFLITNVPDS